MAMIRRRFLAITMFARRPEDERISSDVIRTIIAVTASQRLMSESDRGKLMPSHSLNPNIIVIVLPSGDPSAFCTVTALPVDFATAHAMALAKGHPSR